MAGALKVFKQTDYRMNFCLEVEHISCHGISEMLYIYIFMHMYVCMCYMYIIVTLKGNQQNINSTLLKHVQTQDYRI